MRPLSLFGLLALVLSLAGCGSSSPTADTRSPAQKKLDAHADAFEMKDGKNTKPGELPLNFVDMSGKAVDLASPAYRGNKNVVLVVVKGMPKDPGGAFCPGCLAQVNSLTANYPEFQKLNAEIVMVFPGPENVLPKFLSDGLVTGDDGNSKVPFPLVSDSDLKAVRSLGIEGDYARPSTYILDKSGNVVFAYVAPPKTNHDRPSVKVLLEQLDKLK